MIRFSALLVALGLSLPVARAATPVAAAPAAAPPVGGIEFIPNQRQWDARVLFAANVPGGRLFLEKGRLTQARYDVAAVEAAHHLPRAAQTTARIRAHAYAVEFVGAAPTAEVRGEAATGSRTSYLLGSDSTRWAAGLPGYGAVRYAGLYPGTDLRFYATPSAKGAPDGIEYDFELAPGADPARIALRYAGQSGLSLTPEGALRVSTTVGEVREQRPVAYQVAANGRRVAVRCRYVLGANHTVRFALPDGYDRARPLVIDPVLVYASYTGSTSANWGFTATHDPQGNLYSGSIAFGMGYPVSSGSYDISFNSNIDIAIIKFNPSAPTGQASRVWATFVGGGDEERPHSMVVDAAGNLVVLGTTQSNNFPTSAGAFDRSYSANTDLVVFVLNSAGSAPLVAGTYLGGSAEDGVLDNNSALWNNYGDDYRGDILVDAQRNVLVTAVTRSTNFPVRNAFQTSRAGGHDAVVMKLPPALNALTWSSYFGGTGDDNGYSIQLDSLGGVYVGGGTTSRNLPNLGGLHTTYGGGSADGFILRVNAAGTALTNFTYLGTTAYDQAYFVQLDRQGAVYALGQTAGAYPVSAGVYSNPGSRQFIQKLDAGLSQSLFSTVIGNGNPSSTRPNLSPTAFLVDNCGQILLSGWGGGNIAGMPTTPDALLRTVSNSSGSITTAFGYFYVMQLAPGAQSLIYGTYYGNGSTHSDGGTSRFDKRGVVYQSVCVVETSGVPPLLTTPNAWARMKGSTGNNAAFKMDVLQLQASFVTSNQPLGSPSRVGCAPLLRFFNRPANSVAPGTTTRWDFGNGQTSTQPDNVSTTYTTPGRYIIRLTVNQIGNCQPGLVVTDTVDVLGVPKPNVGTDFFVCPGGSVTLSVLAPDPTATYTWTGPGLNATTGPTVVATPGATPATYIVTGTSAQGGCTNRDTVGVAVVPLPLVALGPDQRVCPGDSVTLAVLAPDPGVTYAWTPTTGLSTTTGATVKAAPGTTTRYVVTGTRQPGNCTASDTVTVSVTPLPKPAVGPDQSICPGDSATLAVLTPAPGATYVWAPATGLNTTAGATVKAAPGATTRYVVTATHQLGGCEARDTITVSVVTVPKPAVGPDRNVCPGDSVTLALLTPAPDVTYVWAPATGLSTTTGPAVVARPLITTVYIVTGTHQSGGCAATDTVTVSVRVVPQAVLSVADSVMVGQGFTYALSPPVTTLIPFVWDFGDGTTSTDSLPDHRYATPGTYTIRLRGATAAGCPVAVSDNIVVTAVPVPLRPFVQPNIITPNTDGANDTFEPYVSTEPVRLTVFNRWGRRVFEQDNYTTGWGKNVAAGTYYYHLTTASGQTWKGWVEVVR